MRLNIKPMSVNQAWKGQKFKTDLYLKYERNVLLMLPNVKAIEPPFRFDFIIGFSNKNSDLDNIFKPLIDIIQKKYNINDRDIYEINAKKEIVEKGKDFIDIKISTI